RPLPRQLENVRQNRARSFPHGLATLAAKRFAALARPALPIAPVENRVELRHDPNTTETQSRTIEPYGSIVLHSTRSLQLVAPAVRRERSRPTTSGHRHQPSPNRARPDPRKDGGLGQERGLASSKYHHHGLRHVRNSGPRLLHSRI